MRFTRVKAFPSRKFHRWCKVADVKGGLWENLGKNIILSKVDEAWSQQINYIGLSHELFFIIQKLKDMNECRIFDLSSYTHSYNFCSEMERVPFGWRTEAGEVENADWYSNFIDFWKKIKTIDFQLKKFMAVFSYERTFRI